MPGHRQARAQLRLWSPKKPPGPPTTTTYRAVFSKAPGFASAAVWPLDRPRSLFDVYGRLYGADEWSGEVARERHGGHAGSLAAGRAPRCQRVKNYSSGGESWAPHRASARPVNELATAFTPDLNLAAVPKSMPAAGTKQRTAFRRLVPNVPDGARRCSIEPAPRCHSTKSSAVGPLHRMRPTIAHHRFAMKEEHRCTFAGSPIHGRRYQRHFAWSPTARTPVHRSSWRPAHSRTGWTHGT